MDTSSVVVLVAGTALVAAVIAALVTKVLSGPANDGTPNPLMLGTALGIIRWLSGPIRDISSTSLNGKIVGYSVWTWNGANWVLQSTFSKGLGGYQEPIEPPTYPNIPNGYTVRVLYKRQGGMSTAKSPATNA